MYYEEKIINGVLCYRTTTFTPFVEMSKEKLTQRIQELELKAQPTERIDPDKELLSEFLKGFKAKY